MGLHGRIDAGRLALVSLAAAMCAVTGVLAGISPALGLAGALGVAFTAAVFADATIGLTLFTVLCFVDVLNFGGGAVSFMKIAGLLLFLSWFAASSTRRHRSSRSMLQRHTLFSVTLIAWVTWSALSVAWAQSSGTAFSSTYRLALDALLIPIVFAAIRKRSHFVWIVGAFIFGSAISALLGLAQSSTGARLAGDR